MRVDSYSIFTGTTLTTGQTITTSAASTNVIDGKASRDLGLGLRPLYVVSQLTANMTDANNNANLTVILTYGAGAGNATTVAQTLHVFAANALSGTRKITAIAPNALPVNNTTDASRFVALNFTVGGAGTLTTGAVVSFITPDIQAFVVNPKGYTGPSSS